jgi:hypothetical protein
MGGNMNNMTKALKKKFKEALLYFEERYQDIEIRDFDDSVFDRAVSLVEDIVYNINRICYVEKYSFVYRFVIPLPQKLLTIYVNLSITKKKFTHTLGLIYKTAFVKPSEVGKGALFVMLYADNLLDCSPLEIERALKNLAFRERLDFRRSFEGGFGYGNPFLKGYYSFEIPFNVEAVEYIL